MIKLRALKHSDAKLMLEWLHDAQIMKNFRFDGSKLMIQDTLEFIDNANNTSTSKHFAIVNEEDEYLGTVSLKNINIIDKKAEYSICLRSTAQGKGVAYEGTRLVIEYAFNVLKLHRVYLNVFEENEKAWKFYEKFGFKYEGTSLDDIYLRDKFHNLKWYAIINE